MPQRNEVSKVLSPKKKKKRKVVEAYQGGQGYKQFLSLYGSNELTILPELFQD